MQSESFAKTHFDILYSKFFIRYCFFGNSNIE